MYNYHFYYYLLCIWLWPESIDKSRALKAFLVFYKSVYSSLRMVVYSRLGTPVRTCPWTDKRLSKTLSRSENLFRLSFLVGYMPSKDHREFLLAKYNCWLSVSDLNVSRSISNLLLPRKRDMFFWRYLLTSVSLSWW